MSGGGGSGAGTGDGRNVDASMGILEGEGSEQVVPDRRAGTEGSAPFDVWPDVPARGGMAGDPTYYDRPAIKEPVWIDAVPAYFYVGGMAGAAATLGVAAQAVDREGMAGLVKRCRWLAAVGGAVGTALLIVDLGRPERFLNMLRVFRPTSPLNVGSWILATEAPLASGSAVLSGAAGAAAAFGDAAGLGAGVVGLPLTGYTGVLLASTAVPVWQGIRRSLPALFVASAASAAASLLNLMSLTEREERVVHRFDVLGTAAELAAAMAVDREVASVERVGRPLRQGLSGALWRASKAMGAASLVLSLLPGKRSRARRVIGAILGTGGAVATKFAVFHAGRASARDPRATFHQQRAGLGGMEATGRAAVTGPGDRRAAQAPS